jgi:hypothetical protein
MKRTRPLNGRTLARAKAYQIGKRHSQEVWTAEAIWGYFEGVFAPGLREEVILGFQEGQIYRQKQLEGGRTPRTFRTLKSTGH